MPIRLFGRSIAFAITIMTIHSAAVFAPSTVAAQQPTQAATGDTTVGACASRAGRWCWGLLGGGSIPTGAYADYGSIGWHFGALTQLMFGEHIRLRADGEYHSFSSKELGSYVVVGQPSVAMGTLDAVIEPFGERDGMVHPYFIAGVGMYDKKFEQVCNSPYCAGSYSASQSDFGWNAGGGVRLNLPGHWNLKGFTAFAEARWHDISGPGSPASGNTRFVPVSIGFMVQ